MKSAQEVKTRQQIAESYGVSRKTSYNWLKRAGIKLGNGLVTPREQQLIYEAFGLPEREKKEVSTSDYPTLPNITH